MATAIDPMTHIRLVNAVTEHDRRASKGKYYNPHALGMYLRAVRQVEVDVQCGATLRQALLVNFNDRLLSRVLKAVGEADFTRDEARWADVTWQRPERIDD